MAGLFDAITLQALPTTTTVADLVTTALATTLKPALEDAPKVLDSGAAVGVSDTTEMSEIDSVKENIDNFFLVLMGSLIIFMQAGFGLLEAGSVRSKNVTNILIKNFADLCFGALSYILFGYAFAFGEGSPFIGYTYFGLVDAPLQAYSYIFFQSTFAATCATIVSGSIAERCNFNGYILFSILQTGVIYPIQSHWCWSSEGWLAGTEFHDYAGSSVVHLSGGTVALVGAIMLGPRIGRFKKNEKGEFPTISGHSIPLICLGAFILIFGFMAFNGGSQGSISNHHDGQTVARAVVSTLVACCVGGQTVLFIVKFMPGGAWSITKLINGCLVGMVSICAGADGFYPWASALTAGVAGVLYVFSSKLMIAFKIDDPLDAVAVHLVGGLWGTFAAPLFMDTGIVYTGSDSAFLMLVWNAVGAGTFIGYNLVTSILVFGFLKAVKLFRVDEAHEIEGLDWIKHREPAYPIDAYIEEEKAPPSLVTQNILYPNVQMNGGGYHPDVWARKMSINSTSIPIPPGMNGLNGVLNGNILTNEQAYHQANNPSLHLTSIQQPTSIPSISGAPMSAPGSMAYIPPQPLHPPTPLPPVSIHPPVAPPHLPNNMSMY